MEKILNRVTILGCACVIISALTVEEIDSFRKYLPEALNLTDETGEKVVYSLEIDNGPGCMMPEKAVFSRVKAQDGLATITILLDPEAEDKGTLVRNQLGASLLLLNALEEQLLSRTEELVEKIQIVDQLIGIL